MAQHAAAAKLISSLLLTIAGYTGFSVPKLHPELDFLPAAELQQRFCRGPCPIHAFFPPGNTIYVESGLDVFHDPAAESILAHELTHWLQQANLAHPEARSCQEWLDREYQAYDVQYRWLREQTGNMRAFSAALAELGGRPLLLPCPASAAGQAAKKPGAGDLPAASGLQH